jgi:hypothetical protein
MVDKLEIKRGCHRYGSDSAFAAGIASQFRNRRCPFVWIPSESVWISANSGFPLLPGIGRLTIVRLRKSGPQSKFEPTMRNKGLPPLENRFEFFGDGMPAAERSPFASSIFEVEERATGTPFNLKLWRKVSSAINDDLRQLFLHEMRQIQRLSSYEGAREVIVDVVEIVEDETSFGIVLRQAGQPLTSKIARATRDRWLKDLANRQPRILFWRNMARIAKAIGIVHSHGLVHGRVDSSAIMTEGRQEPDFLLGGFEWSLWFSADDGKKSHAKLSAQHAAARTEKPYSFEDDWRSFGALIAECLGIEVSVSGEIVLRDGADHAFIDTSEKALLRRLFMPTRLDVNDASEIGRAIRDIIESTPHSRTVGDGSFIVAILPKGVGDAIYTATAGQIATDEFRKQLEWIRADLAGGASLLAPPDFKPTSGRLNLVTESMVYSLVPLDADEGPTWQIAFCIGAQARGGFVGFGTPEEHEIRQPILAEGRRDALRLRDRLGPEALDWSSFAQPVEPTELGRVETVQAALNLVQVVEAVVKALEIYPIELLESTVERSGRRLAMIRALPGSERDKIGKKIGVLETASALFRMFGEDHRDAGGQWRISRSTDLGSPRTDDVVATFVDVVTYHGADAYQFETDDELPEDVQLFLRADSETGTERVFDRHLAAIRTLNTRVDLAEMLDDPWRARRSTNDAVDEKDFEGLDGPKQTALRAIWSTLPSFFVVGPPGVGKTKLATEFIWRQFDVTSARILLSAQGHDALDNLQQKTKEALTERGFDTAIVVRSPSPRRTPTEDDAPAVSAHYLKLLSESTIVREGPVGQRERVHALVRENERLAAAGSRSSRHPAAVTVSEDIRTGLRAMSNLVLDGADVVIAAANSAEIERLVEAREQFDWVIVEEAAKATGPELVGPMMLSSRRLLIGDHRQLPPFGAERAGKILKDHSLVEKTLDIAEQYIGSLMRNGELESLGTIRLDPDKMKEVGALASKLLEPFRTFVEEDEKRTGANTSHRRIAATLTEQRRMDPVIAQIVSDAFYAGDLTTENGRRKEAEAGPMPFDHLAPLPLSPVVVVDFPHVNATRNRERLERAKPRWHNPSEVESVVDVLKLIRAPDRPKKPPTLAILSPYAAQVECLDNRIGAAIRGGELAHLRAFRPVRKEGFVGTVDSFQGSEADLVVMSLVRNNEGSGGSALGFLRDRRRMNVAISRAKWKLVFVGSLQFLKEAVLGVNPDNETHDLTFLTKMTDAIEAAAGKCRGGVPHASIVSPESLKSAR